LLLTLLTLLLAQMMLCCYSLSTIMVGCKYVFFIAVSIEKY